MKKYLCVVTILCIMIFAGSAVHSHVSDSLTFSDEDYIVYIPDGAPEQVWADKDVFYVTAQMSFEYANELLLNDSYEQFEKVFMDCYNKYSENDDIYYVIKKVFLSPHYKYSKVQEELILNCVEDLYQEELSKENNKFLTEKNLLLQVELNYKFHNYIDAFSIKDTMEDVREG